MFVGHAILAFVLASLGATALGWGRRRALYVGIVAACFAVLPDVDMVYAPVGLVDGGSVLELANSFWGASTLVHRGVTHSVVVATLAAGVFGVATRSRIGAGVLGGGLLVGVAATASVLSAAIMSLYVVGGIGIAVFASRHGFGTGTITVAALTGLVSHPFGDVFTGSPPMFLYPFDFVVLSDRVAPFADATLNLLFAFGVELVVIWGGVVVFGWLTESPVVEAVGTRAGVGVGYAGVALVLVPPTMQASYQFVFSALALGVVGIRPSRRSIRDLDAWETIVTGLAAVTFGVLAYTAAYLSVGG